jgi:hypothetical protein
LIAAGLLLVYPAALFDYFGLGFLAAVVLLQKLRPAAMAVESR